MVTVRQGVEIVKAIRYLDRTYVTQSIGPNNHGPTVKY